MPTQVKVSFFFSFIITPEEVLGRFGLVQRRCRDEGRRYKDMLVYPRDYGFTNLDKLFIDRLYASKNEVSLKEYN